MHHWGSAAHALIGLWVLAGLMVVGVNGYMLLALLDEPLAGYSNLVRSADRGFQQYRALLTAETEKITSGLDRLAGRFKPMGAEIEKPTAVNGSSPPPATQVAVTPVMLPTLSGIMTHRSSDGQAHRLAVMDGRVWVAGDRLRDLTIEWIDDGGVYLVKGDQAWFLKAPDITYSLTSR